MKLWNGSQNIRKTTGVIEEFNIGDCEVTEFKYYEDEEEQKIQRREVTSYFKKYSKNIKNCELCEVCFKNGDKIIILPCLHVLHRNNCFQFTVAENGMCPCRINALNLIQKYERKLKDEEKES